MLHLYGDQSIDLQWKSINWFLFECNIEQILVNTLAPTPQNGQTLKQFIGKLPTNYLSMFDHFLELALKGTLMQIWKSPYMFVFV